MTDVVVTQTGVLVMVQPLAPIDVTQAGVLVMVKSSEIDTGVSAEMKAHLASGTTYLCTLWKVVATDGTILRGCNHTRNLTYNSELYKAIPLAPSQLKKSTSLSPNSGDMVAPYIIGGFERRDVINKKWNNARIEITVVNYLDLTMGPARRDVGFLGEISADKHIFTAEYRGLSSRFAQDIGEVYTPDCRATLGDGRCKVDLTGFTHAVTVTAISATYPKRIFTVNLSPAKADKYFRRGKATATSGTNNGLVRDIKTSWGNVIELVIPLPNAVDVGHTFTLIAGCDGTRGTCKATFDNVLNLVAEPDLPGADVVYTFPED